MKSKNGIRKDRRINPAILSFDILYLYYQYNIETVIKILATA